MDQISVCVCHDFNSSEAGTTKQVQHNTDNLSLSGFIKPNNHAKQSHNGGYQLGKSTQGFPI